MPLSANSPIMDSPCVIVVVEDEIIVAMDIRNRLETLGYKVAGLAARGEDAIKLVEQSHPHLVLMDVMLAGDMDGIETARQIRQKFDIPIVFLSAFSSDETFRRAQFTGPFGYVLKPFEGRELWITIEMALYRHQMERQLRETHEWLNTTVNSIGEGIIATDQNGMIKFMNPVAEVLTGWAAREASGVPVEKIFQTVDEQNQQPLENPVSRIFRGDRLPQHNRQTLLVGRNSRRTPISDSAALIRDAKGQVVGAVLVFRDIANERKMTHEVLKTSKLESIGLLAGGIAHDFNNFLTVAFGSLALAKQHARPEEPIYSKIEEAEKACVRARDLTLQLLTFSKGGAPVRKTALLPEVIEESIRFVLRGSNIQSHFSFAEELWPVDIDRGQIGQVLHNLVINALQAMTDGGMLRIRAVNKPIQDGDAIPLSPGRYVHISIQDSGHGIAPEDMPRIFDPFFSTKREGSGLGLAISHSIISKHDGLITAESTLDVGTTFHIYLPASDQSPILQAPKEKAASLGSGCILLMDDEESIRNVVGSMLKHLGYEVETAVDGAEAVRLYAERMKAGKPFTAIIMDLTIPGGMGGAEAMKNILSIDPEAKAIVSSGYSNSPVMANYLSHGFLGAMAKPYSISDLSDCLKEITCKKPATLAVR